MHNSSDNVENRRRASRATTEQYKLMLDFFEKNKGFAESRFVVHHGRQETINKWHQLATLLNNVRIRGPEKTAAQWQVVWRDLKSRTCVKARELRKQIATTGGKFILSDLETRVLAVSGLEFNKEAGENRQIGFESDELGELLRNSSESKSYGVKKSVKGIEKLHYMEKVEAQKKIPTNKNKEPASNVKYSTAQLKIPKNESCECFKEYFSHVVKQQADAATMQAEAAKQLAEAAKQQAEATLLQAKAFDRLATVLEQLAAHLEQKFLKKLT